MSHPVAPWSPPAAPQRSPRTGRLVALVAAAALVSGTAGGVVGAALTDEPSAAPPERSSAVSTSTTGDGAARASTPYSPAIWAQSVAAASGASACTAPIAA